MTKSASLVSPLSFLAGTVFVEPKTRPHPIKASHAEITIRFPSRLDAACTDPGMIYSCSPDRLYPAGQINFCVDICKDISVKIRNDDQILISGLSNRRALIVHAIKLMQYALKLKNGFDVNIKNDLELRHCGLGSSASIIQGIGAAINELYGNPIDQMDLIRYLIGNHGEEIDGDDTRLIQVQSVGGSGVCGHFHGGLIIITGNAVPIIAVNIPEDFKVVFGVPNKYAHPDANTLIIEEVKNAPKFKRASARFADKIAYRLLNQAIPELMVDNYQPMKEFIFDYRWDMGSIKNCSYAYPDIVDLAEQMRPLRNDPDITFIALSTAGPGFFIVTRDTEKAEKIFRDLDMFTYVANIYNDKYKIISRR